MSAKSSASFSLMPFRIGLLFVFLGMSLLPSTTDAQQAGAQPKRILVLYWYNKDFPGHIVFDGSFQETLKSEPAGSVEYYPEYLEANRFPGEGQYLVLREYLRQKYTKTHIDVVVADTDVVLSFLLKYRDELFPNVPIVFTSPTRPSEDQRTAGAGLTGITFSETHGKTLELALRLHPATEQVFVISGTPEHDKRLEAAARPELQGYESRVEITYLTDLSPEDLVAKVQSLPQRSLCLYVWQKTENRQGKVLESADVLALIAEKAPVPIYGMSNINVGIGIVGGYVFTQQANATSAAALALRIAKGTRAQDIPVNSAPSVPMFDWRQLQRWGISENSLPAGSIVLFKQSSFWELYRWRIVGVMALFLLQSLLIGGLLIQRSRRAKAEESRRLSEEKFSKAFRSSPDAFAITREADGVILEINDRWEELFGYGRDEVIGRTALELQLYVNGEDRKKYLQTVAKQGFVHDFETDLHTKSRDVRRVNVSAERITINKIPSLMIIVRDITERKKAEAELQRLTGQLIQVRDEEHRRIAAELHDGLGQSLSIIRNRATLCKEDISDQEGVLEQLDEISGTALSAIDEVREIAHNLRPYELDRLGLVAAVRSMITKVSSITSMRLVPDLDDIDGLLSPAAETSIYRIVQEGLNNVIKHAQASEVRVAIKRQNSGIVLSIEDNGKGIAPVSKSEVGPSDDGFGLQGIAERARILGGVYSIDSKPGQGTTLTIRLNTRESENGR